MRCALVDAKGFVVNFIMADPAKDQSPVLGCVLVPAPDNMAIGAYWDGEHFHNPQSPEPPLIEIAGPSGMEFL